jgi:thiol-disulfide isomerase/thioredoxin
MATPDALLLIAGPCPHCPAVLAALSELVKQGVIGRLEVVNVESRPEVGEALGVRGVPWVRLGPFELEGKRSAAEYRQWAERAGSPDGMRDYFRERLAGGDLQKVLAMVRRDETLFDTLPVLLADPQAELPVRVGIGAILEEFRGSPVLARLVDALGALTRNNEPHLRADAAHLLALTGSARAAAFLKPLLEDSSAQVREVAAEGLELLEKPATGAARA